MLVRLLILIVTFNLISACDSGGSDSPPIATPDFVFIGGNTLITGTPGSPVTFDASSSYSTSNSPLTFVWSSSDITIPDPSTDIQTLTFLTAGLFELDLVVTDENNNSDTQTFLANITD